jgi:hypothetical protein
VVGGSGIKNMMPVECGGHVEAVMDEVRVHRGAWGPTGCPSLSGWVGLDICGPTGGFWVVGPGGFDD